VGRKPPTSQDALAVAFALAVLAVIPEGDLLLLSHKPEKTFPAKSTITALNSFGRCSGAKVAAQLHPLQT
jgi:hypothetical protein